MKIHSQITEILGSKFLDGTPYTTTATVVVNVITSTLHI
jgi:hypothetical protein